MGGAVCCEAEVGGSCTCAGAWTVTGDVVLGATGDLNVGSLLDAMLTSASVSS